MNDKIQIYEGDPHIRIEQFFTVEGNGFAITKLSMGSHSGTHIDAPSHVLSGGKPVSEIPLSDLVGECVVLDKNNTKIPLHMKRVILKGIDEMSGRITEKQARMMVDMGVRLVGTDSLSIGSDKVHEILLSEGCAIMELLDLSKVEAGEYMLCALPLKIAADGSPLRACLIQGVCG